MASVSSNKSNDDGLRPHGRSGLKYRGIVAHGPVLQSPPPRAERVEILYAIIFCSTMAGLRPHGRSGLKS